MSTHTRRQNLGLGKTAAGGSGGSFASHERSSAAPPPAEVDLTDNDAPVTDVGVLDLLNDFDLNHGNAEIELEDGYLNVEAPGHARVYVDFTSMDDTNTMADAKRMIAEQLNSFDPDREFNEIWSSEFGEQNGFTASAFLRSLESDQRHFVMQAEALSASAEDLREHSSNGADSRQAGLTSELSADRRVRSAESLQHAREIESQHGRDSAEYTNAAHDAILTSVDELIPDTQISAVTLDYARGDTPGLEFYSVRDMNGRDVDIDDGTAQQLSTLVSHLQVSETSTLVEVEDPDDKMIFVIPLSRA